MCAAGSFLAIGITCLVNLNITNGLAIQPRDVGFALSSSLLQLKARAPARPGSSGSGGSGGSGSLSESSRDSNPARKKRPSTMRTGSSRTAAAEELQLRLPFGSHAEAFCR
ncbi:hypothetical protein PG994_004898 [Apiospora phragmitis]|uniref:Uncharacterized protein n=1 Tax=Apiospora phragmitis TaxID=2905665 RepID=A0ABR1VVR5_9PEZI